MKVVMSSPTDLDEIVTGGVNIGWDKDTAEVDLRATFCALTGGVEVQSLLGVVRGVNFSELKGPTDADADWVWVDVRRSGSTSVHLLGRSTESTVAHRGESLITDTRSRLVYENPKWDDSVSIAVDRDLLTQAVGGPLPMFTPIPSTSSLLRLARTMALDCVELDDAMTAAEREVTARTLVDLLAAAARAVVIGGPATPTGREALLQILIADIDAHLCDPDLSPRSLAARHFISVRYVHTLFEALQTTPATYIRGRRLLRAKRALEDSTRADVSVSQIGDEVGIPNPTSFVRAFRRQFDITPSECRYLATSQTR